MKKLMRRLLAVAAAMTMVMGMAVTANAQTVGSAKTTDNATITVTNAANGQTYDLYQIFKATYSTKEENGKTVTDNVAYSILDGKGNLVAGRFDGSKWFTVDASGNVSPKDDFSEITLKSDDFKNWAQAYGNKIGNTVTANADGTIEWTGLDYGYYFISTSNGAVVTVDKAAPDATVIDKNEKTPAVDKNKKITKVHDNLTGADVTGAVLGEGITEGETATAKIGDTITFTITFTGTNFGTSTNDDGQVTTEKVTSYTVKDTPEGLAIDPDSITVVVTDGNTDTDKYNITTTVKADKTNTILPTKGVAGSAMTLYIPWTNDGNSIYKSPATVTVTYNAVLKSITDDKANNSATVDWNQYQDNTPDKPEVYTANFQIMKVDSADTTKQLAGAEFDLYEVQTAPDKITTGNDANAEVVGTGTYYKTSFVTGNTNFKKIPVTANGDETYTVAEAENTTPVKIVAGNPTIKGLKANTTYYLVETKAPTGYQLSTHAFEITTSQVNGSAVALASSNITNTSGKALPSTGGMGTMIFYVLGAVLAIGAGVILVTRKRLSK